MMKSTECLEMRKRIDLFLDDLVEPLERQKIERHLSQCGECSKEVEDIRAFELKAANIKRVSLSSSLEFKIMATMKEELAKEIPQPNQENFILQALRTWKFLLEPAGALACLSVVILLFLQVFTSSHPSLKTDEPFFSVSVKSVKGAPQLIRDGKTMKLDGSSNEFTAKIQPGDKIVSSGECESEVRFPGLVSMGILSDTEVECKKNEFFLHHGKASMTFSKLESPFFIKTPHLEVEIVGTELGFDVKDDRTIMYLVSGTVKIKQKDKGVQVMPGSKVIAGVAHNLNVTPYQPGQGIRVLLKTEKTDIKANDDKSW